VYVSFLCGDLGLLTMRFFEVGRSCCLSPATWRERINVGGDTRGRKSASFRRSASLTGSIWRNNLWRRVALRGIERARAGSLQSQYSDTTFPQHQRRLARNDQEEVKPTIYVDSTVPTRVTLSQIWPPAAPATSLLMFSLV
jgi:hypothetical protein